MTKTMTTDLTKDLSVKVSGEQGWYRIFRVEPAQDGSILLYGGDKDPNGVRGYRSVMPDKLVIDKRKRQG